MKTFIYNTFKKTFAEGTPARKAIQQAVMIGFDIRFSKPVVKVNSAFRATGIAQVAIHVDGKMYYVPELWKASKGKEVKEIPTQVITNANESITALGAIDSHNVDGTDTSYPIIVDQHLRILDGRHRWTKARRSNAIHIPVIVVHTDTLRPIGAVTIFGVHMHKDAFKRIVEVHFNK